MKAWKAPSIHPFLLAIYPILALLAYNVEETSLSSSVRALAVSLLGAGLLLVLARLLLHDGERAAILTSLVVVLFFTYGHVYNLLERASGTGLSLGRHRILIPIWIGLLVVGAGWILRTRRDLRPVNRALTLFAALTLVFPVVQTSIFVLRSAQSASQRLEIASNDLRLPQPVPPPDIYYIILDAYSRDDVLEKYYYYDNSAFIEQLTRMGFYVARCSQSNYAQTQLSLASSLNLNPLETLNPEYSAGNTSRAGLPDLIQHSAVRRMLEGLGYQTVAFETGFEFTEIKDAGLYLSPRAIPSLNDFEALLLRTTAARVLAEGITFLDIRPESDARNEAHRQRVLFTLQELPSLLAEVKGPKFVFAHIVSPHWPMVFGPDGEPVEGRVNPKSAYRDQVIFLNKRVISLLAQIIAQSPVPPVIILQADHGSVIEDLPIKMPILNAYYLPGAGDRGLYESISPVNSFRVVFNRYFGAHFPLLEDRANYSHYATPYDYQMIRDDRPGCSG